MRIASFLLVLMLLMFPFSAVGEQQAEEFCIPASLGNLYGILQMPDQEGPVPLVIMCHGFGGSYIWSQDYSDEFVKGGYAAFGLDFCGGGMISKGMGPCWKCLC